MLVCFGSAWPVSVYRSWVSRTAAGKSLAFMIIICTGYIAGFFHKVYFNFDGVIYLYALNALLVFADIMLYLRNKRLDQLRAS
ncbi:hypothetical protein STSP2_00397 [Anaerohalosphaera lusitana]|uniref:PQ loop repeat protein n=1 Tax=Anaerohalosphaera lusitana TaxID=1936003 RepID=A0A1U9NHM8_9BACT|nr:hypothetical protein STSP2_00397 [Anaerohalosphaera lusitana]